MEPFEFTVTVRARNLPDAVSVMRERLDPDEDYGFEYQIEWMTSVEDALELKPDG